MPLKRILFLLCIFPLCGFCLPVIYTNQVAYDAAGPKLALIGVEKKLNAGAVFKITDAGNLKTVYVNKLKGPLKVEEWDKNRMFYQADFSAFFKSGSYKVSIQIDGKDYFSYDFKIGDQELARQTIPALLHYFRKQRANTAAEWAADQQVQLFGSDQKVDLRGGWCDASGDVSKYFSHLAYANFMSPQQIPLVTWSLINTAETIPKLIRSMNLQDSIDSEALWGADYLMRSLSDQGYFYMTVFSYFNKDPNARRVVGLHANSVTTDEYQCAFREGAGMAIAALARVSGWKKQGTFRSSEYLQAAEKAFAHVLVNNKKYTDDGKDNIIDDYCALLAATELWIATDSLFYKNEARKRAKKLQHRLSPEGYFIADDGKRPFWHASDAGLPLVALSRYLKKENDPTLRASIQMTIKKSIRHQLKINAEVENPFGYARQIINTDGKIKSSFFIPHKNETGWWWQGENARLASLAAAVLEGNRALGGKNGAWFKSPYSGFAWNQLDWILGKNPYSVCFMYQMGKKNVPYMQSSFGHGSEKGGISNGITGKDGFDDGGGIDFKEHAAGNEWRWTEQWLPHAAWFLNAVTSLSAEDPVQAKQKPFRIIAIAEKGGHHLEYSMAAKKWLNELAAENNFTIDYVQDTRLFTDQFLQQYQLFIQLDYPPYAWKPDAMEAFKKYIIEGRGSWIGFHHATLLGDFDGYGLWPWFSDFMGGIRFKNYIPAFADGLVKTEQFSHPVMKNIPAKFQIEKEEWYTYDRSPRSNVEVLASVDEGSYRPASAIRMGDHPVIWSNPSMRAKNVYIFMGHSPDLFKNQIYTQIFRNAIFWALGTEAK
ncbi:ThuA domain-containing protein [Pedobacter nutrimenti]|uniref:Type 1 glutamine amidotransferase n=1 Tax=Pedobacter nutrimenti TaxID=1241337 RepID=A0A318UPD6_9SPHI|nr:ThuA domain-containing protein [Pedobacter nutrimenti]PYF77327.1 type 1 glutamine amidotransferase [Pedobacter nutrimenti]